MEAVRAFNNEVIFLFVIFAGICTKIIKDFRACSRMCSVVARSHSAILHIYVSYPFVAIRVGFSMVKRSVDNCNFFKINQEEYTSPMHY